MFLDKKTSIKIWIILIVAYMRNLIFEEPGSNVLSRSIHVVLS